LSSTGVLSKTKDMVDVGYPLLVKLSYATPSLARAFTSLLLDVEDVRDP
jgi:hypothetical protein